MINLRSDNESKVFPEILNYIDKINNMASKAYGEDEITEKAKSLLCDFFETEVKVFFLVLISNFLQIQMRVLLDI